MPIRPSIVERPEQPYVAISGLVTMQTVGAIADRLPEVFVWLAEHGLCRAWQAGKGGEHGKREDSTAFRALAAAAGGADKIAAYCQATTPGRSAGQEHGQGPPPDRGSGRGNGEPPPTSGS